MIFSHNYKLDTPPGIYNVFYVSLLKRAVNDPFPNQRQGDFRLPAVIMDKEEEWEMECVLREYVRGR